MTVYSFSKDTSKVVITYNGGKSIPIPFKKQITIPLKAIDCFIN